MDRRQARWTRGCLSDQGLAVDLLGRLSNPAEPLETLVGQGITDAREVPEEGLEHQECAPRPSEPDRQDPSSPLSNPAPPAASPARGLTRDDRDIPPPQPARKVQRRLPASGIDELSQRYVDGTSIDELARAFSVNRTTIIRHLDTQGAPRRRVVRKMTDTLVAEAALRYLDGHSLATVAQKFKVDATTLGREFRRAGVAIRPRRGWQY